MKESFDFFAPPPPPPPFDISEPQQSEPSPLTANASDKESGRVGFEQKRAVGKLRDSRDGSRFGTDFRKATVKPEEDIDQSAEAFIKKFHTELRMQRLESIENYHQMLARGT